MLSCEEVVALSSRLTDGELTRRERMGLYLHIAMCNRCRRFIGNFRAMVARLKNESLLESMGADPSQESVEKTLAALNAKSQRKS